MKTTIRDRRYNARDDRYQLLSHRDSGHPKRYVIPQHDLAFINKRISRKRETQKERNRQIDKKKERER